MRSIFVFILLFFNQFSYPAFAPDTLLYTPYDIVSLRDLQPGQPILSYDEQTHSLAHGTIQDSSSYQTTHAYKIICDDGTSFITAPEQRLMLYDSHTWIEVQDLVSGDRLLCHDVSRRSQRMKTDNKFVTVSVITPLEYETLLCEVTVTPHHTLLVTERGIIAHNFVIATVPPLAAGIWAGVATAGVMSSVIWNFFSKDSGNNSDSYDEDYDCSYASSPPPPKDPHNKDKYENMKEVFKRAPIGEKLKRVTRRTNFHYKKSRIYRVIQDVDELGIKKGDLLYLDKMHKDHIEVFNKNGTELRTILNMNGTQNLMKIKQAGVRDILECL